APLRAEGKLAEAVAAAEKVVVINREVYGVGRDLAGSLAQLADLQEEQGNLTAARKVRQEALAVTVAAHGATHWRAARARLALAAVEQIARLNAKQRQRLATTRQLLKQSMELEKQERFGSALRAARQALAVRKDLLGEDHPLTTDSR